MTKRWGLDGKHLADYENLGDWAYQARFGAQDGLVLAGNWAGRIRVWNAESKERRADFTTNPAPRQNLVVAESEPVEGGE